MNNEQLTQEIIHLKEQQAKGIAEHEKFELILKELQEDVKSTKSLAEDVHIMALNMENMQKTLNDTTIKVDALTSKEFIEYKESKKLVKQNVISKVTGAITGALITGLVWLIVTYINTH